MSKQQEDLSSQRFERWLVISYNEDVSKQKGKPYWNCICDCGNTKVVRGNSLKSGGSKSCGCLTKEITSERSIKDLTGQRFGRLIVIKENGRNKQCGVRWLCKCECGNECNVNSTDLIRGATKSCGCLAKEVHSSIMKEMLDEMWRDENYREQKSKNSKEYMTRLWSEDRSNGGQRTKKLREHNEQRWQDEEYREAHTGENSVHYNPNLTEEDRQDRRLQEGYNNWKQEVKKQANYTCDCCNVKGVKLHSHHLESYNSNKELRLDFNNGVCLCEHCHKEFHKMYGYGNNTKQQYIEFKENKLKGDGK